MRNRRKNKPILVLGGTGHYGRHIVWSLLKKGEPVRVLSRNATKARNIIGDGAEIIEGDITSRESVVESLKGASAVVISVSAFTWKLIRKLKLIEQDSVLMVSVVSIALTILLWIVAILIGWFIFVEVVIRIIRRFIHFPIPAFIARFIDNPIRRRIQPPTKVVDW